MLRLRFTSNQIKYYINDVPVLVASYPTGQTNPHFPALLDTSFFNTGSKLTDVQLCSGNTLAAQAVESGAGVPELNIGQQKQEQASVSFGDVQQGEYYYEAVQQLAGQGVISGYADGSFRPFAQVTRGQLAKIVVLAAGELLRTPERASFSDVAAGSTYYQYVETAVWARLVSGYADGTFRPHAAVTRGQLAKMVVLGMGIPLDGEASSFHDVTASNPFKEYIETAYKRGLISGYADGSYQPAASATRGQVAKIIYQATGDLRSR